MGRSAHSVTRLFGGHWRMACFCVPPLLRFMGAKLSACKNHTILPRVKAGNVVSGQSVGWGSGSGVSTDSPGT